MPAKRASQPKAKRKAAATPAQPQRPFQRRYKSAAEVLQDLLPQLAAVGGATRGKQRNWRPVYLKAMAHCANVTISSRIAGVTVEGVRAARKNDAEFAAVEEIALSQGIDLVEASAFKSAVYGDLKPVYHQGILCGEVLEYSDAMRALLLKGRRPEVYKDRQEQSGTVNVVNTHMTRAEFKARVAAAKENRDRKKGE